MPSRVQQFSRITNKRQVIYRDFKRNLDVQPITGELDVYVNERAIIRSIENLVLTFPGERYYHPEIGSTVVQSMFDFVDKFASDRMVETIKSTINRFEPRATNLKIAVTADPQHNAYIVDIAFEVINLGTGQVNVPTIVLRVR